MSWGLAFPIPIFTLKVDSVLTRADQEASASPGPVRVLFRTALDDVFCVVKIFDYEEPAALSSIKFWRTKDIAKCVSYWKTRTPVRDPFARERCVVAARVLLHDMGITRQ
jgi:hypothetical protein